MMEECTHPNLVHIVNTEDGGTDSKVYLCKACHTLLLVEIKPDVITVGTSGLPEKSK